MADRNLLRPRLSRKTAGANFMSPAKYLDPDRLTVRGLDRLIRLQADLTLAWATHARGDANRSVSRSSNSTRRSGAAVLLLHGGANDDLTSGGSSGHDQGRSESVRQGAREFGSDCPKHRSDLP